MARKQMFLNIDRHAPDSIAVIEDSGERITYGGLVEFTDKFTSDISASSLIFILSENSIGALSAYVAALSDHIVPLIISSETDKALLDRLIEIYRPSYLWVPGKMRSNYTHPTVFSQFGYELLSTGLEPFELHQDLALLLSTSGSTGSPKLVRHSLANVEANAQNVAAVFEMKVSDKPIVTLPIHYTMGLSVATSHLYAGATLLLVKRTLTDPNFWNFIKENKATSFTGVPYSFEILKKLRFFRMDLPDLQILSQGGGKLRAELFEAFAQYAERSGKKFIATYGQTEGTARMAFLPASKAISKIGSIGQAIPGGKLFLIDDEGQAIEKMEAEGELVYEGPNVTLGYATKGEDLAKGDENNGVIRTGDIAKRDQDGDFFIVGRMKRFLKIYGSRISLDELEQLVLSNFDLDCVCTGYDEKIIVRINNQEFQNEVKSFLTKKTGLFNKAFEVNVGEVLRNEAGKVIF